MHLQRKRTTPFISTKVMNMVNNTEFQLVFLYLLDCLLEFSVCSLLASVLACLRPCVCMSLYYLSYADSSMKCVEIHARKTGC